MASIASLYVELQLRADNFNTQIKNAQKEVGAFQKSWAPTISVVETAMKTVVAAGTAIAAAIGTATKVAADYGDKIRDASVRTGLATQTLSGLKLMVEQNGSSFEELNSGLKVLAKNFVEATHGGTSQIKAFEALGISTIQLKAANGDLDAIMRLVMDRLEEMPEGARKTEAMLGLMGKGAIGLTEAFSQGSAALDAHIEKTRLLGLSVTPEAAAAADDFNDSLNMLKQAVLGATVTTGNQFIPSLTELVNHATAAVVVLRQLGETLIGVGKMATLAAETFTGLKVDLTAIFDVIPGGRLLFAGMTKTMHDLEAAEDKITQTTQDYAEGQRMTSLLVEAAAESQAKHKKRLEEAAVAAEKLQKEIKALAGSTEDMKVSVETTQAVVETFQASLEAGNQQLSTSFKQTYQDYLDSVRDTAAAQVESVEGLIAIQQQANGEMAKIKKAEDDKAAEAKKNAESYQRVWENAMGNVTAGLAKSLTDAIFHGKNFKDSMINVAKQAAEGMLQAFLTGLLSPLTSALGKIGSNLASAISGGGSFGGIFSGVFGGGGAAAGGAGAAGGAAGGGMGAGLAGFFSNPWTIGIGAALGIGGLLASKIGQGRKTANEFVNQIQNPFHTQVLAPIVDQFNAAFQAGQLSVSDAQETITQLNRVWGSFQEEANAFAQRGETESKVVNQAFNTLTPIITQILADMTANLTTLLEAEASAAAQLARQKAEVDAAAAGLAAFNSMSGADVEAMARYGISAGELTLRRQFGLPLPERLDLAGVGQVLGGGGGIARETTVSIGPGGSSTTATSSPGPDRTTASGVQADRPIQVTLVMDKQAVGHVMLPSLQELVTHGGMRLEFGR